MSDVENPLIPAGYDIVWSLIAALALVLVVLALVTLVRGAKHLSSSQVLLWSALVVFVPVLGAVAWLTVGHRAVAASKGG